MIYVHCRDNKAPPLMLVLLWHHFCYYKRNRGLLIVSILLPITLMAVIMLLVWQLNIVGPSGSGIGQPLYISPTEQQTVNFLSSGVLQYVQGGYSCYQGDTATPECDANKYKCDSSSMANATYYSDRSLLDYALNTTAPLCDRINITSLTCDDIFSKYFYKYDPTLALMAGYIVYYPNQTNSTADMIMRKVKGKLETYAAFIAKSDQDVSHSDYPTIWDSLKNYAAISNCWINVSQRIIGFETRDDLIAYTQSNLDNQSLIHNKNDKVPLLWGAINFEHAQDSNNTKTFSYSIMKEHGTTDNVHKDIWLQDLIEEAAIKLFANVPAVPISVTMKELPTKCLIRPNTFTFTLLLNFFPAAVTIGFFLMPITFLTLVIREKYFRLGEYLSIMGVSDFMLKLSWIVFFLLFLIPLALIVALMLYFTPANVFADSDPSILFVIFVAYNISQLTYGYMLSSLMTSPAKVRFIIAFVNVFLSVFSFSSYNLSGGRISGAFLIILRILSLNASTPFNLALCYVISWENVWVGAHWKNFLDSPNKGDGYHGFGECILWMLGDSILYIILGWYFKHIMPSLYGIKYPPYFFVLPSYWCPKQSEESGQTIHESRSKADFEPNTRDQVPGVVLNSLSKKYVGDRYAVNNLSLTFYKNEVTAFLGENGAGKSTTMNILVGLIGSTSGTATINGLDVATKLNEVRKFIGFVPQYDILYPDLTVEEHIQFYGWLKGLSTSQIWSKADLLLKQFDLEDTKKTVATKLSGGQKRKLSVISAYMGNPEVVILDEPTSGVDPFSRRSIWDIVNLNRKNTTTILSTHYMEEADVLGDRIAIISLGELKCAGSGMYLKNRYGQGYRITVATTNKSQDSSEVEHFMQQYIQETKLVHQSGNDKTFAIPIEIAQSPKMINLLEHFEESKDKLGVSSFGISEPTLEDVFFKSTGSKAKANNEHIKNYGATLNREETARKSTLNHLTGFELIWAQFVALIMKRKWITFRSRSTVIMQILLPMSFVLVMILISQGWTATSSDQTTIDFYLSYRKNVLFFQNHDEMGIGLDLLNNATKYGLDPQKIYDSNQPPLPYPNIPVVLNGNCPCASLYCDNNEAKSYQSEVLPSNDIIYPLASSTNVTEWLILANQSNHWVIGGFEFFKMDQTVVYQLNNEVSSAYNISQMILDNTTTLDYVVIWTVPQLSMATLNAFNNLLIRSLGTDFSLLLNTETADLIASTKDSSTQIVSAISSATTCYFLIMAYIFATFGLADFLLIERKLGLRQLQFIAGANPVNYWCANLLWDFLQFAVTTSGTFLLLGLIPNLFSDDLLIIFLIVLPFSIGSISFIYFMTFFLDNPGSLSRLLNLGALLFQVVSSVVSIFNIISDENEYICQQDGTSPCSGVSSWVTPISSVLCLIPYYNLAECITYISLVRTLGNYNFGDSDSSGAFVNLLAFDRLGRRIMEAWIAAVIIFIGVILLEYKRYTKFTFSKKQQKQVNGIMLKERDADVVQEEHKVTSNLNLDDPLVVRNVVKFYQNKVYPAVNNVSFSIPRGQCFGLLGVNGAGKTSLFRILSGMQTATSGTAAIESFDINGDWRKIGENISYCPQDNTLFFQLTTENHLELFGKLRGIKSGHLKTEMERLIKQVGLEDQLGKIAFSLSGGNQRKLQFALALLDYRPLIFLDEPTTGMDPTARRLAWNSISDALNHGCSVVLTSHSMEECEELCHRLVIMVLGSFSCIGSIQYLKDKFGNKYTFKVKLTPSSDSNAAHRIKEYFSKSLKNAVLIEEHNVLLVFEISADGLKVSYLFKTLQDSVRNFPNLIEDFAISQITLEHVFINMAERQQMLNAEQNNAVV